MADTPRWSEATDLLARHVATERPTHCDACSLRWPCDVYDLAASHERLLAACDALIADADAWEPGYSVPGSVHGAAPSEYVEIETATVAAVRAAIAQARGEQP